MQPPPLLTIASLNDIPLIQSIAWNTWPKTFVNIISSEQISYMLDAMYNTKTLTSLMNHPNFTFYLINGDAGMAALELHFGKGPVSKLHKLYILPENHGKGWGRDTIRQLEIVAREAGDHALILNVNKKNPATHFYEKCGFTLWKSVVIDIGQGFVMDDYIFRKELMG